MRFLGLQRPAFVLDVDEGSLPLRRFLGRKLHADLTHEVLGSGAGVHVVVAALLQLGALGQQLLQHLAGKLRGLALIGLALGFLHLFQQLHELGLELAAVLHVLGRLVGLLALAIFGLLLLLFLLRLIQPTQQVLDVLRVLIVVLFRHVHHDPLVVGDKVVGDARDEEVNAQRGLSGVLDGCADAHDAEGQLGHEHGVLDQV